MRGPKIGHIQRFEVSAIQLQNEWSEMLVMISSASSFASETTSRVHMMQYKLMGLPQYSVPLAQGLWWVSPDLRTAGVCLHVVSSWMRGAVRACVWDCDSR